MMPYLIWCAVGFFSGSVMYSYLIPKWFYGRDITQISKDGNPGCGNVFTCIGIPCGIFCLLLELAKGAVPLRLAAERLDVTSPLFAAVMAAPVLGHAFSPMLHRRGGKAIAVTFGTMIGVFPHMAVLFWLALPLVVFSTVIRICPHSLRVMVSYICMLLLTLGLESGSAARLGALLIAATVIYKHFGDYVGREKRRFDIYLFQYRLFGRKARNAVSSQPAGQYHHT